MPGLMVIQEKKEDAVVLHAQGRLTVEDITGLKRNLEQVWRVKVTRVIVNLTDCPYVDSSGIALLVEALKRSRKESKGFSLVGVSPQVQAVLELTRLDRVFEVFATVEGALTGSVAP
ncbi:MAG: STAS domain-containing protein [Candidatus Acidiferrales bacterium]